MDQEAGLRENEEVANGPSLEEALDEYSKEIYDKLFSLRQELGEEQFLNQELQTLKCDMEGRIQVKIQQMDLEESSMGYLKGKMAEAKEELLKTEKEAAEYCRKLQDAGFLAFQTVWSTLHEYENLRHQYDSLASINDHMSKETGVAQDVDQKISNIKDQISTTKASTNDILSSLDNFTAIDVTLDQLRNDIMETEFKIGELKYKLGLR